MATRKKAVVEEEEAGSLSGKLGDFGSAVMQIADEKGIAREKILEIVEAALAAAYKKDYGKRGQVIRAAFDEVTKETKYFLVKEVVDPSTRDFTIVEEPIEEEPKHNKHDDRRAPFIEVEEVVDEDRLPRYNSERDILVEDAQKIKKGVSLGDTVEIELESHDEFGRVAAQTAKQVIIQRVREAEREGMFEEYKSREGEVVNGTIQRIEGRNVFLDLGKSVGVLFPSEQIEGENYRMGQHLKVLLVRVEADPKGPGLLLSRSHPDMVKHLFSLEVPEIYSGIVVVNAIAREAGSRTKIAVSTTQEGVDPIGSCVGQKGTRVQAVIDELGGEKIDIIEWNEDPKRFISAALSPAKVLSAELTDDENGKRAMVLVPADQLSLAIGKRGQNVRLAAKLTGWRIDVAAAEVKAEEVAEETAEEVEA
ncbi:MAG: transcription termination/antitermination protein NusA [Patescibacteria group bacterium]|nr:transcription termination/antitermination protein NusA [Patescibacteria group bacterium]